MVKIPDGLDVWVLAGQSNMQGCGALVGVLEQDERVFSFTSAGKWEVACEPLHRLWESFTPVHQLFMRAGYPESAGKTDEEMARIEDETRVGGSGLGISFAKTLADALGKPIGIIPAAHGGTSLEQWNQNKKDQGGSSLYGAMLERIKLAGGNVKGILWYQGESDANENDAVNYQERIISWIEAARADTGILDLPVIVVQLGRFVYPDQSIAHWWDVVREALRTLPDVCPNTACVSANDLGLADAIHIDTPGLIRLGRRMAQAALRMEQKLPAGPDVVRVEKCKADQPHIGALKVICKGVTGKWNPEHHIAGFELFDGEGNPHQTRFVIVADRDKDDPTSIRVTLTEPLVDNNARLGYGLGLNPYCNAIDDSDMPLNSFLPMTIE